MGCGASSRANSAPSSSPAAPSRAQFDVSNMFMRSQALTPAAPYKHGSPITEGQLRHMREEFWGTRIGGNALMWQAIQTASEAILVGDLLLANAILEASCITTPTGSLDTCYDETGYMYRVPAFIYSNPIELVEGNVPAAIAPPTDNDATDVDKETHSGSIVKLKVRINPGDVNLSVSVYSNDTVAQLKKAILLQSMEAHEKLSTTPVCEESRQRVMFMGKELQNNNLISQVGMDDGRVVQVFIRPAASTSTSSLATAVTNT